MEAITNVYVALGLYGVVIISTLFIALIVVSVKAYGLLEANKLSFHQNDILKKEKFALEGQVAEQAKTINKQKTQISELEEIFKEQNKRLEQYESFMSALKEAQEKEKVKAAKAGKPIDEVYVAPKPTPTSSNNSALLMGGLMLARVALMTIGIPPVF